MLDKHIVINCSDILTAGTREKAGPLLQLRANSGSAFIVLTRQEEKSNGGECFFNITYRYVINKCNQLTFCQLKIVSWCLMKFQIFKCCWYTCKFSEIKFISPEMHLVTLIVVEVTCTSTYEDLLHVYVCWVKEEFLICSYLFSEKIVLKIFPYHDHDCYLIL